ncbi:MAG: hypothetical protein DA329_12105 [Candidatus Nitrosocosmicus sp.]|nr:hypothetical protein [Candidatus Nitrosocosmicus sp.]
MSNNLHALSRFAIIGISMILVFVIVNGILYFGNDNSSFALRANTSSILPTVKDSNFLVEEYATDLKSPAAMSFIGDNKILVTEKDIGAVQMLVEGEKNSVPVLTVKVTKKDERGLLGISTSTDDSNGKIFVYLFFTEAGEKKGEVLGNKIYRYELIDDFLTNPKLILELPANPGPSHNGGVLSIGPDNHLYASVGDMFPTKLFNTIPQFHTRAQNYVDGSIPDGRAGILIMDKDGMPIENGILGQEFPTNLYYAYGIKNSFGMDFDPVTGHLWITENGPQFGDEINMAEPGFNSGWRYIMGVWNVTDTSDMGAIADADDIQKLENFNGNGKYSEPEFTWEHTTAPSAIKFLNSDKYGSDYKNDLFVGDVKFGNLYHFKLNEDRTELILDGVLQDKIAESTKDLGPVIFGSGFGAIVDMEMGPDGYLYILSFSKEEGKIYRLVPQ